MTLVNRIVGGIVGVFMPVLGALGPALGVAVLSLATAVALLLVVRVASNQPRIVAVKRSIRAALFEIRLFNDDLRAILRAQGEILRHNVTYLRLSLTPMLWVLVPLLLLMGHVQAYYGYAGMEPGRSALIKVALDEGWRGAQDADLSAGPELTLEPPPGIRVETPRVWIPSLNEATWRIAAERSGDYELIVRMRGTPFAKTVHASNTVAARSAVRPGAGTIDQWLHPVEPPLPPASMLRSIAVAYPERAIRILGWDIHWTVAFFGLTMIFAFALKGRFGVVL